MLPIVDLKWLNSWSRINIEPKTRDFRSSTTYTTYLSKKKKKDRIYIYSFIWWTINCTECSMTLSTSSSIWMSLHYAYEIKYSLLRKFLCFSNQLNAFFVTVTSFALFTLLGGNLTPPQAFTSWTPSLEKKIKKKKKKKEKKKGSKMHVSDSVFPHMYPQTIHCTENLKLSTKPKNCPKNPNIVHT